MDPDEAVRVNTVRFLSVDMVEAAKSGHPGLPLGAAPMAYVLWDRFLKHDPANPHWWDRDRFVLSAGHGSALLYSLLHLTGYDLSLDDLKHFRQFGSRTPGHPERRHTPGVEVTTGPLGQGFANAVGLALAQRYLASRFNRPGFEIVNHTTYVIASDGDLMEGIASEAASFAGAMRVNRLIVLYDDNHISLEGPTSLSFTEDVEARFRAYGWRVSHVPDGTDLDAIATAIREAQAENDGPCLIRVRTHIGYGSPRQDTKEAHGEPLGAAGTRATKEKLGWPVEPPFLIPEEVLAHFRQALPRGAALEVEWNRRFIEYRLIHPELADEFVRMLSGRLPPGWDSVVPTFPPNTPVATRDASHDVLRSFADHLPEIIGGSADLAPSTRTLLEGLGDFSFLTECGRNIHFGVRENAMVAIVNGMAAHGGLRPFGATFLIFSDYAKPAVRLSALMQVPSTVVFTHDSIALGEDGPTHEPVEQLAALRAIPGYTVLRPADANETVEAWRTVLLSPEPAAIVLTRQKLPVLDVDRYPIRTGVIRGAYILEEAAGGHPDIVLIGTGSEVQLCLEARRQLEDRNVRARVVSMPSWELFEEQEASYRAAVLPAGIPRITVEAASPLGWERYAGPGGIVIGLNRFGASAPGPVVLEKLGFTVGRVVGAAMELMEAAASRKPHGP
jgi:transketolase